MKKSLLFSILLLVVLTGCTNKNSDLSCTYTDSYDVTYKVSYTFKNGVVATIDQTIMTPASMVENPDFFRENYENINQNVNGCDASYIEDNGYYVSNYKCDINVISEEDAHNIFAQSTDDLKQTRKAIIDFHKKEEAGSNGEKTICK